MIMFSAHMVNLSIQKRPFYTMKTMHNNKSIVTVIYMNYESITINHSKSRDDQPYIENWQVVLLTLIMMIIIDESIKEQRFGQLFELKLSTDSQQ